ncbi:MAG: hypothetical protein ABJF04_16905 [Reichenbachiella sp.]|uniref:hypothetical protein n=1 Tax=Reichenbachiella sp. TaxID=2184521 RepID=UPI003265DE7D
MKLIIALGIKELQKELSQVFKDNKIPIFSKVNIEGFKTEDNEVDMTNWFVKDVHADFSVMFFAFVPAGQADSILKAIDDLNLSRKRVNAFHAFQLPVEKFV